MSIPLPNAGGKKTEYKSICDKYDGTAGTTGLCNGWITATSTCTRRSDELGKSCDGMGKFPPDITAKFQS
ncbi:MAG: hypothetical protein ACXAE3_05565 [Candidatus Kariarchaeaceae archaeon]|jgi:hypothetical protein